MAQTQLDWNKIQPELNERGVLIEKLYENYTSRGLGWLKNESSKHRSMFLLLVDPRETSLTVTIDEPWKRARKVWTQAEISHSTEGQKNRFFCFVNYLSSIFNMGTPLKYLHPNGVFVAKWGTPEELENERKEFLPETHEL